MPLSSLAFEVRPTRRPHTEDLKHVRTLILTSRHVYRLISYGMAVDCEDNAAPPYHDLERERDYGSLCRREEALYAAFADSPDEKRRALAEHVHNAHR